MWTMRNQQPINIRNERLEGISLHNLEEERTPRSVCMHLYLINLYFFFLIGATLVG